MMMGQRTPQLEDGKVPFRSIWEYALVRNVVRGSALIMRTRSKISLDNFLSFDLLSPCGYSYVIISCDETTRGVQTKPRTEFSFHAEVRVELPRDANLQRGNRNNDLAK